MDSYIFFIDVSYNITSYDNQILAFPVPTSLPSGFSYPPNYTFENIFGGLGLPTVSRTPHLIIPPLTSSPTIGNFLGFGSSSGTQVPSLLGSGAVITYTVTSPTGYINSLTIVNGGSGYVNPSLTFAGGTGAVVNLTITNGVITGYKILSGGVGGYTAGTAGIIVDGKLFNDIFLVFK